MPTHVALLRGINVGGGGKLPMADLRALLHSIGYKDVKTYIQTGNILFTPARASDDQDALAGELHQAITSKFGIRTSVVVLTTAEFAQAIARNPYPDEPEPRYVHGVFFSSEPEKGAAAWVSEQAAAAADQGSTDEATLIGRTLYVRTPDGFGTSELAKTLLMKRTSPVSSGTARNWNTISKLLALCED